MTKNVVQLRGITWNHSRGFLPMAATAQRFEETHPEVSILWTKRTLQEFADYPVQKLAETFDLLIIDHPFVGYAANHPVLLPLDDYLPADYLADQAANSVGPSHASYQYGGHQWALAVDGATPVSAARLDLLEAAAASVPQTWEELLGLARRGLVAVAALPVDCLMNFFMLCATQGELPCADPEMFISEDLGGWALEQLRELVSLCPPACLSWNPIQTYEAMTGRDSIGYCPFAYSYSNYARPGYARKVLYFDDLVSLGRHGGLRSTLGGTGLAISVTCRYPEIALEYAQFVASGACQRTLYFQSGGQPAHRSAWLDDEVNRASHNFFRNSLPAMERAYLRPRYDGYIYFQDYGGPVVHEYLAQGGEPALFVRRLQRLYLESVAIGGSGGD